MAKLAKFLQGVAGAGGAGGLNVEDVFSTYLYTGDSSTGQTITNGIDLAGEGGMVWFKTRSSANGHNIYDTERGDGVLQYITSEASITNSTNPWSPTSTGFFTGRDFGGSENQNGSTTVSWTFRKAPKFFTVVTYTGDGTSNRQISHDLGGTVGHIAVKRTDTSAEFFNWHRTFSDNQLVAFTGTYAVGTYSNYLVTADSTTFTVGNNVDVNANGGTYVAYLWGHNDGDGDFGPNGDADIIKCGSYTHSGSAWTEDLGFEPQFVISKNTTSTGAWQIVDNMRGLLADNGSGTAYARLLKAEVSNAENNASGINITSTGLEGDGTGGGGSGTYIYIAIRRGPMAVPESATDVFAIDEGDGVGAVSAYTSGFPVDFAIDRTATTTSPNYVATRLLQGTRLQTDGTNAEASESAYYFDYMEGWRKFARAAGNYSWMWRRAPNYFDVVAYTGNGTAGRTVSHNLGVAPEMMWVKSRDDAYPWPVYHKDLTSANKYLNLNANDPEAGSTNRWNDTAPTASVFTLGNGTNTNKSGSDFIAYLFATLAGVSKVGSYSGNGSTQTIDCGFSAGARFVLIKRTNGTGGWYLFDTERGIVSGNDPYLELNDTGGQNSTTDYIDPDNSGFALTQNGLINAGSGEYIFYAIA